MSCQPKNKKICLVTSHYPPHEWGGLARSVVRVAGHAQGMGLEVHVAHLRVIDDICVLLDENRQDALEDGIIVHRLTVGREKMPQGDRGLYDCPHTFTLRMMYHALEKLQQSINFDLLHAFFLYPIGYLVAVLAQRLGRPSIITLLGNDIKKYTFSPEKVAVCRAGLERADRVTALSQDLIDMADALTPIKHKARTIHPTVERPHKTWRPPKDRGAPLKIGCAGTFKYAKGLPYLFKAAARIREGRNLILELVGELRESEAQVYEAMLARTGVADLLVFKPPLPHEHVPDWLRTLDVFVLPSISEGCPHILMEAMASGVPCVATRVGATEDLIQDRVSGRLVERGEATPLAAALAEVLDDPEQRRLLGAAGRQRILEKFSPQKEARAYEEVYRELLKF